MEPTPTPKALTWTLDKGFTSLALVLAYDQANNRPSGMLAGWSMTCSMKPWLHCVSLWKKGYTHQLIQQTQEFVVAIPNQKLIPAVKLFGSTHGDQVDKFTKSKLKTDKAKFVNTPLLPDATVNLECKLVNEVDCGDHILFIGQVLAAYINEHEKMLINVGKQNPAGQYIEI